jgi:hypothetical protein
VRRERGAAPALEERFHYLAHWRVESDRAGRWKHKSTAYRGRREIWSSWGEGEGAGMVTLGRGDP